MDDSARERLREKIEQDLQPTVNSLGRLSGDAIDQLKKSNPNLADVLQEFALSKTVRDDPKFEAKRIVEALEAREEQSRLGQALANLEKELNENCE